MKYQDINALLSTYKEDNSFNYDLLISYLLNRIDNGYYSITNPTILLKLQNYKDQTNSINFLITLAELCDYKQIIKKYN